MRKPLAIFKGDTHLRDDIPVCRTDDYMAAQTRKLLWLKELQQELDVPILDSGDLFHHWKPSPFLLQYALQNHPENTIAVPGNHDLPAHSLESYDKCGIGVLEHAGKMTVLTESNSVFLDLDNRFGFQHAIYPFPWGMPLGKGPVERDKTNGVMDIALAHVFNYVGRSPWPGCTAPLASSLLKQMEGYDVVVTGDNHKPFVAELDGRLLVNPGSMMRMTADQADHKPRVYVWYSDNTVEPMYFPIEEGVVTREHIAKDEAKDERMSAFIETLGGQFEVGMSFEKNLTEFFASNRVRSGVQKIVWACVKGE